ncbi:fumarylacetoacetate hydrolase family protein [Luteococcus peritonei]|uniref:Fumarylacetoacetate hydrolase family protein n=1 Tax=Luteococcus peritonei TaxID=88874 RepID=A0ABW4RX17_9ACTN
MTADAARQLIEQATGTAPGKIIAVHLNYPSRCAERGRTPAEASYFLKPTSSLAGSGEVERPQGFELLAYEGEVALVIGRTARRVAPEQAWQHVAFVTASNDLGLQDLRAADKGSNVRSKGADGCTALGPELIDATRVRPDGLRVRTWLDGELVQDDTTDTLLFGFDHLIADLTRTITLEPGDVILTGTPAGASVALPGQRIEVEVSSVDDEQLTSGRLATTVVEAPAVGEWGSRPAATAAATADAWGSREVRSGTVAEDEEPGFVLTDELRERLGQVAVATISSQLRKRGYDTAFDGVHLIDPGKKFVGTARTLRYVPRRPDITKRIGAGYNAQKRAIDSVNPGEVLVMEARGFTHAGTIGDILATRAKVRGCVGVITDGAVRDHEAVKATGLPVLAQAAHPAVLGRVHVPYDIDVTISCGGTTVEVGDVIVADDDGALLIPPFLVEEVLAASEQQELEEVYVLERVQAGESVDGLYPLGPRTRPGYEQWLAEHPEHEAHPGHPKHHQN